MKKFFAVVGMLVGLFLILMGFLAMLGVFGGNTTHGTTPFSYDHGYATFGADFYNYVNNNAAVSAYNTEYTADNLDDIADFMKIFFGLLTMCFGAITFCGFGVVLSSTPKAEKKQITAAAPAAEVPAEEPAPEVPAAEEAPETPTEEAPEAPAEETPAEETPAE